MRESCEVPFFVFLFLLLATARGGILCLFASTFSKRLLGFPALDGTCLAFF